MTDYIVPCLLLAAALLALRRKENAYDILLSGAADGLKMLITIIPALILLLTAVSMLRASGAVEMISTVFAPVFSFFGIPKETAMLVLVRPISGSAALAVGAELMREYGTEDSCRDAGINRDHFLCYQRIFRCSWCPENPLRHPRSSDRGLYRILYGFAYLPTLMDIKYGASKQMRRQFIRFSPAYWYRDSYGIPRTAGIETP